MCSKYSILRHYRTKPNRKICFLHLFGIDMEILIIFPELSLIVTFYGGLFFDELMTPSIRGERNLFIGSILT